jgi:predicted amidohydrolase YtcJ
MIERILYNGSIITQDERHPRVSALAVALGRIVAFGADEEIKALASPNTVLDNLGGKTVIPGLTDAHIHWEATARALHTVDVFEVPDKIVAAQRVAERAAQTPPGQWIIGFGWFQDIWPDKVFPTAADLDAAVPQHPVFLMAKSVHAAWANSLALRQAGITASTPDPEGGQIMRDAAGEPTGLLLENAMELVRRHIPEPTTEQIADEMRAAQRLALAAGLTGIHDYDEPSCLRALQVLRERGQLALRVVKNINKDWLAAALDSGLRWGFGDTWIRLGGLKIFADGALGPRTAAMFESYEGEPDNFGIITTDKEEVVELVIRASAAGLPATIHAIGDRAVSNVLDVYEIVRRQEAEWGVPPDQRRHRIEHVQIVRPEDVSRLAKLRVIASMQPIHATADYLMADRCWGARAQWSYNPRIMLDAGVTVAFGSDSPVEAFEPLKGLHAAVTRQRPDGSPGSDGWYPSARLRIQEALHGFTLGPAFAAGLEQQVGRLSPGYAADLVVLSRDLFTIPAAEILEIEVLATMVGGIWRYEGV